MLLGPFQMTRVMWVLALILWALTASVPYYFHQEASFSLVALEIRIDHFIEFLMTLAALGAVILYFWLPGLIGRRIMQDVSKEGFVDVRDFDQDTLAAHTMTALLVRLGLAGAVVLMGCFVGLQLSVPAKALPFSFVSLVLFIRARPTTERLRAYLK